MAPHDPDTAPADPTTPHVRVALWDMDGTLLDTETLSTEAITAAIGEFGCACDWPLKQKLLGKSIRVWPQIVINERSLEGKITAEDVASRWQQHMIANDATCAIMPGVLPLLAHLKACGIRMGICTSSPKATVEHKRATRPQLFQFFEAIVTGDDPELKHGKPAPDIYLLCAQRMGVDPKHCVVFEDARSGVEAGRAAGMPVVAIPDPRLCSEFQGLADVVLPSLDDFVPEAVGLPPFAVAESR